MDASKTVATAKVLPVHIRWMLRGDLPEVLRIERESFEYAWAEGDFLEALAEPAYVGMVAVSYDRIVGYMFYSLHRDRIGVLNFAVDRCFRRAGVGRQMVDKLKGKLRCRRRAHLFLSARDANLPAHLFFRACGFKATDVLRGFYEDSGDDAYVFNYDHDPAADPGPGRARRPDPRPDPRPAGPQQA